MESRTTSLYAECVSSTRGPHFQAGYKSGQTIAAQLRVTIRSAFNIHYPTDSSLLGDGVRVLTRTMKRIVEIAGKTGEQVRDRMKSVGRRLLEIGRTHVRTPLQSITDILYAA